MEDSERLFKVLVLLSVIQGITCEENSLTGVIAAATVAGFLLCATIVLAIFFIIWRDMLKKQQLKNGKIKIPRSWLKQEKLEKKERRQRLKQQMKEHIRQKEIARTNGSADMELNYLHKNRPQIPGTWRNEIRHPNGYIVKEVPTLQRNPASENHYMQSVIVDTEENPSVWQRVSDSGEPRYMQPVIESVVPPHASRGGDVDSLSSADSIVKVRQKLINTSFTEDEVIEATLDFENEDAIDERNQKQEIATAF